MKLEECIRALNSHFSQVSTVSLRSRFSRLREIMMVLTSDLTLHTSGHSTASSSANTAASSHLLHHLGLAYITELEAQTFLVLRTDYREQSTD